MRRRPHFLAALGAGGVVVLSVAVVGFAVAAVSPRSAPIPVEEAPIPEDMVWPWISHCIGQTGIDYNRYSTTYFSVDGEGTLDIEFGTVDQEGAVTTDEEVTALVGGCVESRRLETEFNRSRRMPTDAERLQIYDWAVRLQEPCLAAHRFPATPHPLADYMNHDLMPWYLLQERIWTDTGGLVDDFDVLLEARLACPPLPAFLAAQGVG
jgi:hypothetical protein